MIVNYVGTNYKSVIKSCEYKFIEKLDDLLFKLYKYYNTLFFKQKVQCHICATATDVYFYDPYLFQFIIDNDVFVNNGDYVYIGQPVELPATFGFKYDKTFFRALEECDMRYFKIHSTSAVRITQPFSLFKSRKEAYYQIDYDTPGFYDEQLSVIDSDLIEAIKNNRLFPVDSNKNIYNIIIKYFNKTKLTSMDIEAIETLNYLDSEILYYAIPEVMFVLKKYIQNILK